MFPTVRNKIDRLLEAGYISRYENPQIIWERMDWN
jgi:DNA-binding MarR family transcriptional regulator